MSSTAGSPPCSRSRCVPADPDGASPRLEARLSAFDTSMIVVSLVVGIGIFRTPALVAAATGTTGRTLAAWAIGGAASLTGALVFSEIGSRFPHAGGYYRVVAHCWRPMTAFLLNWSQVLKESAGAAGVAVIGAEYLLRLGGGRVPPAGATTAIAAALLGGLILLNVAGIRAAARAQNLLSLAKIVLILGLAASGLLLSGGSGRPEAVTAHAVSGAAPAGMLAALVAVFYAFGGYQNTINLGGDVKNPRRNLPLGVVGGMTIVTAIYLLVNVAYVTTLGQEGVAGSPLVGADLARAVFGRAGETFVSLAIFLSAAGFLNAAILHLPRAYLAMAEDGLLPAVLGRTNPRTGSQPGGLVFFAATSLGPLFLLGTFEKLLGYVIFTDVLGLTVAASCLFVLRKQGAGGAGLFRMPGYPWLPAAFVAILTGVAGDICFRQPRLAAAGVAVVLAGVPLYYAMKRGWGGPDGRRARIGEP